jgi:hypothetical protein
MGYNVMLWYTGERLNQITISYTYPFFVVRVFKIYSCSYLIAKLVPQPSFRSWAL